MNGLSTCQWYLSCGNGIVDLDQYEECDDTSSCCVNCKLAAGAECSGESSITTDCCSDDGSCKLLPTTTACGTNDPINGFCANNGVCRIAQGFELCQSYQGIVANFQTCPMKTDLPCHLNCDNSGSCFDVTGYNSALFVPNGAYCVQAEQDGTCTDGTCVVPSSAVCGNGVVDLGEECDDDSRCCVSCQLATGAVCSESECCNECGFELATKSCLGGLGYCSRGKCEQHESMCTFTIGSQTTSVSTITCPIQPGCTQQCLVPTLRLTSRTSSALVSMPSLSPGS